MILADIRSAGNRYIVMIIGFGGRVYRKRPLLLRRHNSLFTCTDAYAILEVSVSVGFVVRKRS